MQIRTTQSKRGRRTAYNVEKYKTIYQTANEREI